MVHPLQYGQCRPALVGIAIILGSGSTRAQAPSPTQPTAPPAYPAAPPPLTTGGLSPPPTSLRPAGEAETLTQLERAEREDSGRGLEFVWLNAEAGYEYLALQALNGDSLVDAAVLEDAGSGLMLGAGAGVRLIFLTLGARFRLAQFADWDLWTLSGELGLHVPLGALEPSFSIGAGYARLGAFSPSAASGPLEVGAASGFDVRLGAALDWYVNPLLSLGVQGSLEMLALSRDGARQPAGTTGAAAAASDVYARDGSGVGLGVTLGAVAGLHF